MRFSLFSGGVICFKCCKIAVSMAFLGVSVVVGVFDDTDGSGISASTFSHVGLSTF
jgi:hypothetical protein